MKKALLFFLLATGIFSGAYAQLPQQFKYQGVARDQAGELMLNRNINLRISIVDSASGGTMVYQEVHKTATNQFGLYAVNIGDGIQPSGVFTNIPWQTGNKWMRVEIDPNAGSTFTFMGATQLVSVPYALFALTAATAQNTNDADADPANELITGVSFNAATNVITISEGGNAWTVDLSALSGATLSAGAGISITGNTISNTGDLSASNELNTGFTFNSITNQLSITDAGNTFTVDLSSLAGGSALSAGAGISISGGVIDNTGDLSASNELISGISFNAGTNELSVTDAGGIHVADLSALAGTNFSAGNGISITGNVIDNTGDLSAANELITAVVFDTVSKTLTISEAGNDFPVDLSALTGGGGDDDWDANGSHIYNTNTGNVGIGTMNPAAQLHIAGGNGLLATGTFGSGNIPATGAGVRLMWYPGKAAIRAGNVNGTNWDDANIANWSVAMGNNTRASGPCAVAMGEAVIAQGAISTSFGQSNNATGDVSTALGANTNASGTRSTSTGWSTLAAGNNSFVMGNLTIAAGENSFSQGFRTTAAGRNSVALGNFVNTNNFEGTFMFGDNSVSVVPLNATANNQFIVRAIGGSKFFSNDSATVGVQLLPGDNSWSAVSDYHKKENFQPIDREELLKKISQFSFYTWNYKGQDPFKHRHYGPMAQEFHAAFGNDGIGSVGTDTTINLSDLLGVSIAAIQALELRTQELQQKIEALEKQNAALQKNESAKKSQKPARKKSKYVCIVPRF